MARDRKGHHRHRGGRAAALRTRPTPKRSPHWQDDMGPAIKQAKRLTIVTGVMHYVHRAPGEPWKVKKWSRG